MSSVINKIVIVLKNTEVEGRVHEGVLGSCVLGRASSHASPVT